MSNNSQQAHWPNNWVFILAAIGSDAGIGNLWRFPFLAYDHGGAAFVVAMIVANLLIGIPLLALETGLGQMMQKGAADAFGAIKKSFRFLGWTALMMGFMVLSYYMAVVGWGINFFASAFTLSWGADTQDFFLNTVLQLSPGVSEMGGFSWPVVAGFLLAWVLVYFIVWKGVKGISKVVVWTATLPFALLAILIVRAITLPGAGEGLELFFLPDWSALLSTELWLAAFSQVFFSLSLAFGIMVAYGSLKKRDSEMLNGVAWITLGNFLVSIMSGIVVFATLGYMALQQNVPVTEVVAGGPALVFIVLPQAINLLPALNEVVAVLFFGAVLLLAIDSAFSLLEAVTTTVRNRFPSASTKKVAFVVSVFGVIAGLIFTTKAGLYYLDIIDHFIVNYGLVIVGILEALVVAYFWKGGELRKFIQDRSSWRMDVWWDFSIKFFIPVFLTIFLVINIVNELKAPYEGYPVAAIIWMGVVPIILAPFIGAILDKLTTNTTTKN